MNRIPFMLIALALSLASEIAMADVVVVVSAKSPVMALSKNQLIDIFLGKVSRYPDGTEAMPLDQAEGSGDRDEFYARAADKSAAQIKAYWSKIIFTGRGQPPPTVSNGLEVRKRIRENPAAIGYIDRALVDDTVRVLF
jgi:ABC-type phosphate transport system substrate-binding protein